MAAPYDLNLVQNETYERTFRWMVDGVPQPLGDFLIRAQVRAREDRGSTLLLDLLPYINLEASAEGQDLDRIRLRIPATVTAELNPKAFRRAAWDLFLIEVADPTEAFALVEGAATCNPSATDT